LHRGGGKESFRGGKWGASGGDNIHNEQEIITEVLRRIKPSQEEEERLRKAVETLLSNAKEEMERRGYDGDAVLVGSVAKGTYLKNPDIDIFLRFPPELDREELKKRGIEIGRALLPNGFTKYAEHPYWRGEFMGFQVDIVPCYRITKVEERKSAVDRTPFHTNYVRSHLEEWQRDEVRLLKAFMKGIRVYGAEARVRGFSGYLSELLIIKYGSFRSVLENASRWRKKVVLWLEPSDEKFRAPLVFIDPVDPKRNVASAVSEESKALFIHASKSYLEEPRIEFFFPKEPMARSREDIEERIRERSTHFYVITMPRPDIIEDNLYPQVERTLEAFRKILSEFLPLSSFYIVSQNAIHFILELERDVLPAVKSREGPPVWHENSKKFLERWKGRALRGPYIIGSRWYADIPREVRTPRDILLREVKNYKLGAAFEKMKDRIEIGKLEEKIDEIDLKSLSEFFFFSLPWER
jgi:tRNA nucleotidyltransferase (CCA-adding enzyme)